MNTVHCLQFQYDKARKICFGTLQTAFCFGGGLGQGCKGFVKPVTEIPGLKMEESQ